MGGLALAATLVGVPRDRGARYTKGHPSGRCAARRAALREARPRVAGVGARPGAGSQQGRGLRRRAPVRLEQPPPRSRAQVADEAGPRVPSQGESPDEGSATRVNRPLAAAVTAGAAVPCWLDRRAAARAAAQLRALQPTPVTPRPFSAVTSVRLVTGNGTSRTPVPPTSNLPTEDSPVEDRPSTEVRTTLAGGGQAVHGGPNDPWPVGWRFWPGGRCKLARWGRLWCPALPQVKDAGRSDVARKPNPCAAKRTSAHAEKRMLAAVPMCVHSVPLLSRTRRHVPAPDLPLSGPPVTLLWR